MKNIGTIIIHGQKHKLHQAFYDNGRIAIAIDEGMYGKLTVNLPDNPLAPGHLHVKAWGENELLREPALATGLFEDTGERIPFGFVKAEIWKMKGPMAEQTKTLRERAEDQLASTDRLQVHKPGTVGYSVTVSAVQVLLLQLDEATAQRDMLIEAISEAAKAAGMLRNTASPDGPLALMLAQNMGEELAKFAGAEVVRQLEIGHAVERACEVLPEGYEISIELERGAGTIHLYLPGADAAGEHEFDCDTFGGKINAAINQATGERNG